VAPYLPPTHPRHRGLPCRRLKRRPPGWTSHHRQPQPETQAATWARPVRRSSRPVRRRSSSTLRVPNRCRAQRGELEESSWRSFPHGLQAGHPSAGWPELRPQATRTWLLSPRRLPPGRCSPAGAGSTASSSLNHRHRKPLSMSQMCCSALLPICAAAALDIALEGQVPLDSPPAGVAHGHRR